MSERKQTLLALVMIGLPILVAAYVAGHMQGRAEQKKVDAAVKEVPPLTTYWVICDDGFVIWEHGSANDQSRSTLCGEHGGKDPRQIQIKSAMGYDWKVVVTPINESPAPAPPAAPTPGVSLVKPNVIYCGDRPCSEFSARPARKRHRMNMHWEGDSGGQPMITFPAQPHGQDVPMLEQPQFIFSEETLRRLFNPTSMAEWKTIADNCLQSGFAWTLKSADGAGECTMFKSAVPPEKP